MDNRTLAYLVIATGTVCSILLVASFPWRLQRSASSQWALADITLTIGVALLVTQGSSPVLVGVLASNLAIGLSQVILCVGIRRFWRLPTSRTLNAAVFFGFALAFAAFSLLWPSTTARIVLVSLLVGAYWIHDGLLFLGKRKELRGRIPAVLCLLFLVLGAAFLARAGISLFFPAFSMIAEGIISTLTFLALDFGLLGWTIGLILLKNLSLMEDLAEAQRLARMGAWFWDASTGTLTGTEEMHRIFGLDPAARNFTELGERPGSFFPAQDWARVQAAARRSLETGADISFEAGALREGSAIHVAVRGLAVRDEAGRVVGLRGTVQDITERKRTALVLEQKEAYLEVQAEELEAQNLELRSSNCELERAHAALREAQERTAAILEGIADTFYSLDEQWRFTGMNPAAELAPFGRPVKDLLGKSIWDEYPGLVGTRIHQHYLDALANKTLEHYTAQSPLNWRWYEVFMKGRTGGIDVYMRDVTERKKAEEALEKSEARFKELTESITDSFTAMDSELRYTYWNKAAERISGISAEQALGRTRHEVFGDNEASDRVVAHCRRCMETGEAQSYENDYFFRGKRYVFGVSVYPANDGVTIIGTDITEKKAAEREREWLIEALDRRMAELDAAFEVLPYLVSIHGPDGKYLRANSAITRLFGFDPVSSPREETARRLDARFADGRRLSPANMPSTRALQGESVFGAEYLITDCQGRERVISFNAVPLLIEGRQYGAVFAQEDITERKRYERELEEARGLAELYLDLMGHDISNMHQVMLMQLELAQIIMDSKGRIEDGNRVLIDGPIETLGRAAKLIENVRSLRKLNMGAFPFQTIDLGRILDDVLKIYSAIPGRDIAIRSRLEGEYPVKANSILKDVFINLLDNAVKHSVGVLEIAVDVQSAEHRGLPFYRVAIEDNGRGIADDQKEAVFHRLRRGGTKAKGTGLGLFLVKSLVEGFGGYTEVQDRVEGDHTRGSRFLVYLPAAGGDAL